MDQLATTSVEHSTNDEHLSRKLTAAVSARLQVRPTVAGDDAFHAIDHGAGEVGEFVVQPVGDRVAACCESCVRTTLGGASITLQETSAVLRSCTCRKGNS